jgi:uncharacterized membrane protein
VLNTLLFYFVLFILYSFLGWCLEMVVCYCATKKWVNRGFLLGPICPIYGCGCLIITILLKGYLEDSKVLFVMAVVLCSILEYFTSYIMEKLFKARWWDYSDKKYNINGRICLENSVAFGVLGLLLSYVINPFIVKMLSFIPTSIFNIIAIIIWVLFVVDNAVSFKVISGFTRVAKTIKKDSTEEITKKVREILTKQGYLYRRLVSAFNFQASEKLIQNIKDRVVNETKKVISNGINKTNEAKNKIIAGSKEKINELKSKAKKNKKIK